MIIELQPLYLREVIYWQGKEITSDNYTNFLALLKMVRYGFITPHASSLSYPPRKNGSFLQTVLLLFVRFGTEYQLSRTHWFLLVLSIFSQRTLLNINCFFRCSKKWHISWWDGLIIFWFIFLFLHLPQWFNNS